jgi:membrane-bound ClpP family serine protease
MKVQKIHRLIIYILLSIAGIALLIVNATTPTNAIDQLTSILVYVSAILILLDVVVYFWIFEVALSDIENSES